MVHFGWGEKGPRGEIDTAGPYNAKRLHRRQPVGGVSSAAPGYHYTRDHLLPLDLPTAACNQPQPLVSSSPSRHASVTRII